MPPGQPAKRHELVEEGDSADENDEASDEIAAVVEPAWIFLHLLCSLLHPLLHAALNGYLPRLPFLRDDEDEDNVDENTRPTGENQGNEEDTEQNWVQAEVLTEATAHTGDHAVGAGTGKAFEFFHTFA